MRARRERDDRQQRVIRWARAVAAALAAIGLAAIVTTDAVKSATIEPGKIKVVDGNTIRANGKTYRLVGFAAPKTGSRASCEAERTMGSWVAGRLRKLVAAGGLDLVRVPCACRNGTEGTTNCNHRRTCAVLRAHGRDVGTILISETNAMPSEYDWCRGA
jgi:endonuclease YncB( thermonuclease family)